MENHSAMALQTVRKIIRHAKHPEDNLAKQDVVNHLIEIDNPWADRLWIQLIIMNWPWHCQNPGEITSHIDVEWTEPEPVKLKMLVEQITNGGVARIQRVHRWDLACISIGLGDNTDLNNFPDPRYVEWLLSSVWISELSNGSKKPFQWWLSSNQWIILNLLKMKNQVRNCFPFCKIIKTHCGMNL